MTGIEVAMIAIAIAGTAVSVHSAQQQNEAIQMQMNVNARNNRLRAQHNLKKTVVIQKQAGDSMAIEMMKQERKAHQVRGIVQAAAASAGLSTDSGSYAQILHQTYYEEAYNKEIADRQHDMVIDKIQSDYTAGVINSNAAYENMIASAMSRAQNPFLAGLSGAISSSASALQIGSAAKTHGFFGA
ncbi:MAG: hypothetical protein CL902_03345 [Dehalococcoidia bacterium]|nr:hypothetical protein [Dehalococcoidia bacterium]|tara:strand:+ start:163 stop:720 length:558 start_codon:yes stop_codon:yes gene_type:complete